MYIITKSNNIWLEIHNNLNKNKLRDLGLDAYNVILGESRFLPMHTFLLKSVTDSFLDVYR